MIIKSLQDAAAKQAADADARLNALREEEKREHETDEQKVKRLAEVEAILAEADVSAAPAELSPEEAAKAKWLADRARPTWGPDNSGLY